MPLPACLGGGLFNRVGGWKTGLCIVCSNACMAWVVTVTTPNLILEPVQRGWIGADDGYAVLSCGMWNCLRITRVPEPSGDGFKDRGTWEWQSITDTFRDCTDLKEHVQAFQAFGIILFLCVAWTWLNHMANMLCDCMRRLRRFLFVFHFVDCFVALLTFSIMAGAFNQDLCGDDGVALKDYRIGDSGLNLGMVVFGNTVLIFFFSGFAGFLCLFGGYQADDESAAVFAEEAALAEQPALAEKADPPAADDAA